MLGTHILTYSGPSHIRSLFNQAPRLSEQSSLAIMHIIINYIISITHGVKMLDRKRV